MADPKFEKLRPLEFEATRCPVCDADEADALFDKKMHGYTIHFDQCRRCRTLYTNPRLTKASLPNLYASEEFFEGKDDSINYYSFLAGYPYLSRTARARLDQIDKYARGKKMLEVASAAGFFLNQAKLAGYDVEGVEISKPMAEYASQRWGVPVRPESIEDVDLPSCAYDVIAAWGVFTIVRSPKATLAKFYDALKPGGVLAFNTYYNESLWGRLWRQNWYILVLNTSQIHSRDTLRRLLEEAGFEVRQRRREWPYASIKYAAFQLLSHVPGGVNRRWLDKLDFLNNFLVRIPAPDVYEWICTKPESRDGTH